MSLTVKPDSNESATSSLTTRFTEYTGSNVVLGVVRSPVSYAFNNCHVFSFRIY